MAFYDVFEQLCDRNGATPTQVARDNGIKQSVVAMWKKRGSTPKAETVQKLADYFGVSVGDLLGDTFGKAQFIYLGPSMNGFYLYDLGFLNFKLRSVDCELLEGKSGIRFPDGDLELNEAELWELNGKTDSYIRSKLVELREKHKDSFTPKAETPPQASAEPQEGKDTTPPSDAPEKPTKDE